MWVAIWWQWVFRFSLSDWVLVLVLLVQWVSEFDHGFVYVFACLDAKKNEIKEKKILNFYFLGNHVVGGRT